MDGADRAASAAELAGWWSWCRLHAEQYPRADFETDLAPAFRYGVAARRSWRDARWNSDLEREMGEEWLLHRGHSRLDWTQARALARQGFEGFRGPRCSREPAVPPRIPQRRLAASRLSHWWRRLCGLPA